MATDDGADISVHYDRLREFALGAADMSFGNTPGLMANAQCTSGMLHGCEEFRKADAEASANMMRTLTQARSLLNGIRTATVTIADTYRDTEDHVVDELNSVAVPGSDPARIAPELENAQAQNPAPTQVTGDGPTPH